MFLLKKFLSVWLMPLPFSLAALFVGLVLLGSTKQTNLGRFLLACGTFALLVFSNKFISTQLVRPLEATYPPIPELLNGVTLPTDLASCRAVVVLGGGHGEMPGLAAIEKLSASSRARLTEGVRLLRVLPGAKLFVTGGGAPDHVSHAAVQADAAISLGIAPDRIVRLDRPRDTEEEAEALSRLIGDEPFALVTSAWHLRRATALMKNRGLHPVPCPCDFTARPANTLTWTDFLWDTESLGRSTRGISERLGFMWSQTRGKI